MQNFAIGTFVTITRGLNSGRRSQIVEIRSNLGPRPIYVLAMGGFFSADELSAH